MLRLLTRPLAAVLFAATVPIGLASTAAASSAATTSVTMTSEAGDYIGQGAHRVYYPGAGTVSVSGSVSSTVSVNVQGTDSSDYFTLTFAAASGQSLTTGTYLDAERTPFRSAGHPGIDISGSGRGCNTIAGSFRVLDVAPDLSRLWLTYEQHCEGQDPALFGEVRINEPGGDSDLLVTPSRIDWPAEYPTVPGRSVPVRLVNTGSQPVTITGASVTPGQGDFTVVDNGCGALAVGAWCTVYVGFTPVAAGARAATLTVSDTTPAGSHSVALSGTGIAGHTTWQMTSQPGDYIGGGQSWSYTPSTATITASGDATHVHVGVDTPTGGWWDADLESANGVALTAGTTYTGATRYPFNATAEPGLSVTGMGRGCNTVTGRFAIYEIAFSGGKLSAFSATFEQHCEGGTAALFGSLAWKATDAARPVPNDLTPPGPVTGLVVAPALGTATLSWTNPGDVDWSDTVVRVAPGLAAPGLTGGTQAYAGRGTTTDVPAPTPGSAYSFSVFSRDTSGNVSAVVSATVRGTALSLSSAVGKGRNVTLSGELTDNQATAVAGLAGRSVGLYSRPVGSSTWTLVTTLTTASDGSYAWTFRPSATLEYQTRFGGSAGYLGRLSASVTVAK